MDSLGGGDESRTVRSCARPNCFAPETPCNLGSLLEQCAFFAQRGGNDGAGSSPVSADEATTLDEAEGKQSASTPSLSAQASLPWSANSLGSIDLEFVAARSKPRVIGVIGNQNAGKTTLLTVLYLLLQRGKAPGDRRFAGSFTLGGWEALARHLRWSAGQPPRFPPHTPRGMRRVPGLLHLAFRKTTVSRTSELSGGLEDVLLTDPPGEWFGSWSVDANAASAEGARWIATHSDSFALLVDREALAGAERGKAREELLRLTQRLAPHAKDKRVAIIWSKADIDVRENIYRTLTAAFDSFLPGHRVFSVQVPLADAKPAASAATRTSDGSIATILDLITWLLDTPRTRNIDPNILLTNPGDQHRGDPFLSYARTL